MPLCACGVPVDPWATTCPKCDRPTVAARAGILEVDVAHAGQDAARAVREAEAALTEATRLMAAGLCLVVGRGDRLPLAVKDRARRWLVDGRITRMEAAPGNPGALHLWLKP